MRKGKARTFKEVASKLVAEARKRAKKKGEVCSIISRDLWEVLERGICEATGLRMDIEGYTTYAGSGPSFFSPSIDRIDNTRGYEKSNIRIVLFAVNCMKGVEDDKLCECFCSMFLSKRGWICISPSIKDKVKICNLE